MFIYGNTKSAFTTEMLIGCLRGRDEVLMARHMHKDILAMSTKGRIRGETK